MSETPKPLRPEDWVKSFHDFLLARANEPFVWGEHDCALFAADGILAISGVDIAADFRGQYHDEASALAAIAAVTGIESGTIEHAASYCADKHGLAEWRYPKMAQRGDLVVIEDAGR